MFKQTSVDHIKRKHIPRKDTHIVVAMCFYPRGLKKELRDEYRGDLAPDEELFKDFKKFEKTVGHNEAFKECDYEKRFTLSAEALQRLQELSELALEKDVYFVCQCRVSERCHREMLMLTARKLFNSKTSMVYNEYPEYEKRLETLK